MNGPVNSGGGPYLVLPEAVASAWRGSHDGAAYDAVCRGPDEGRITTIAGRGALILGTPDALYYASAGDGGVFARVVAFDADDDDLLASLLEKLPEDGWDAIEGTLAVDGPLLAFDSAIPGDEAEGEGLRIELAPGSYAVTSMTLSPDGAEFLLTRLARL